MNEIAVKAAEARCPRPRHPTQPAPTLVRPLADANAARRAQAIIVADPPSKALAARATRAALRVVRKSDTLDEYVFRVARLAV